jgi:hypothetical protein
MKFPLFSIFVAALLIGQMAPERIDPPANCQESFPCADLHCPCDFYCQTHQAETVLEGLCLLLEKGVKDENRRIDE